VVPAQADHLGTDIVLELENRVDTAPGVATSIDVVTEKHDRVTRSGLAENLVEEVVEGRPIAVDITNCDGGHVEA
jgi:hypothetical protein